MIECLRSFCLVTSRGLAHLATLDLVSLMLRCVIVKTVKLVDPIEMRKTDSFGKTRLVLHVPSSPWAGKHDYCYYYYYTCTDTCTSARTHARAHARTHIRTHLCICIQTSA